MFQFKRRSGLVYALRKLGNFPAAKLWCGNLLSDFIPCHLLVAIKGIFKRFNFELVPASSI